MSVSPEYLVRLKVKSGVPNDRMDREKRVGWNFDMFRSSSRGMNTVELSSTWRQQQADMEYSMETWQSQSYKPRRHSSRGFSEIDLL